MRTFLLLCQRIFNGVFYVHRGELKTVTLTYKLSGTAFVCKNVRNNVDAFKHVYAVHSVDLLFFIGYFVDPYFVKDQAIISPYKF